MTRTTTGHPARAIRGGVVLLAMWLVYRAPGIERDFNAAVAGARGATAAAFLDRTSPGTRTLPARVPTFTADPYSAAVAADPATPALGHRNPPRRAVRPLPTTFELTKAEPATTPPIVQTSGAEAVAAPELATTAATREPTASDRAAPGDLADRAYARLAAGDRRDAARLFDAALAAGADPRAANWRAQRAALGHRWSGSAYSIVRARGPVDLAVTPVLGGGQSGAAVAWAVDPLARRPLAVIGRATLAHDDGGHSALAAIGIAWHPLPGVTLAAERLVALGPAAHGDWTTRIAGGGATGRGRVDASVYGEAGVVGSAVYAAIQGHVGAIARRGRVTFSPGVGAWASVERAAGRTVDRVDLGPGVSTRAGPFALAADYRFRVAGNAAPASGPVLTLTAAF